MQVENNKDLPFLMLKGRRGNLIMGIHRDHMIQYYRDLWKWEEIRITTKTYFRVEGKSLEHVKGFMEMYNYCTNAIKSLIGFDKNREGSEDSSRDISSAKGGLGLSAL